jgi:hypothetical protein
MKRFSLILLALALIALSSGARAPGGDTAQGYDLSRWTVDGGGGSVGAGTYRVVGTIGQPDAGPALTAGGYTLVGGFWSGVSSLERYPLYLPLLLRTGA